MDLNSLSGKDLDKYGESRGIPRYQGLGLPEDDDSYRKSIRQGLNMEVKANVQPQGYKPIFHVGNELLYGVLVIDPDDGSVVRVAAEYNGNGLAIYATQSQALDQAYIWTRQNKSTSTYEFEVREITLFEGSIVWSSCD